MSDPLRTYCIEATKLGIIGGLSYEWEDYRSALSGACIRLNAIEDELRWLGGDGYGFPSARNLYRDVS
jgi:hypothetical protein